MAPLCDDGVFASLVVCFLFPRPLVRALPVGSLVEWLLLPLAGHLLCLPQLFFRFCAFVFALDSPLCVCPLSSSSSSVLPVLGRSGSCAAVAFAPLQDGFLLLWILGTLFALSLLSSSPSTKIKQLHDVEGFST